MRTIVRNVVLAAGAILLCSSGTAQASPSTMLKANVPFPFVVNGQEFPAGMYSVQRDEMTSSVLWIRGEGRNHSVALLSTMPDTGQDPAGFKPALTFKHREHQYRLASVWTSQNQGWDVVAR